MNSNSVGSGDSLPRLEKVIGSLAVGLGLSIAPALDAAHASLTAKSSMIAGGGLPSAQLSAPGSVSYVAPTPMVVETAPPPKPSVSRTTSGTANMVFGKYDYGRGSRQAKQAQQQAQIPATQTKTVKRTKATEAKTPAPAAAPVLKQKASATSVTAVSSGPTKLTEEVALEGAINKRDANKARCAELATVVRSTDSKMTSLARDITNLERKVVAVDKKIAAAKLAGERQLLAGDKAKLLDDLKYVRSTI